MHNSQLDEQLTVQTPEQITVQYTVADVGTRFMAIAVDGLLQYLPVIFLMIIAGNTDSTSLLSSYGFVVAAILAFLIQFGYFILFEQMMSGQTPGKRLVGLRVVREDGRPLTFIHVLIRNMIRIVDFFPAFYSLGLIVMLCNKRAKRLGDFAAGTLVVRETKQANLSTLSSIAAVSRDRDDRLPGIERLTQRDIETIEQLFARRYQMANPIELEARLATALCKKMGTPEAEQLLMRSASMFLNRLIDDFRDQ